MPQLDEQRFFILDKVHSDLKKISIIHPYIENRYDEISSGKYPKNHLWGIDALSNLSNTSIKIIECPSLSIHPLLEKLINRFLFKNNSSIDIEIAALKASKTSDLIYSVSGPLGLSRFYKKSCKLISWVFRIPETTYGCLFHPYSKHNLVHYSGFCCLTKNCYVDFKNYGQSQFIPWYIDMELFCPDNSRTNHKKGFFLATGKTRRDYKTFIRACEHLDVEVRIIAPNSQRPTILPSNIKWFDSSNNPPDKAISYSTLRDWYDECLAVCIPLEDDEEDTCGYTNMLEAMSMRKPVLMTKSGCLDINPKKNGFGLLINPYDYNGWSTAMNKLANNPHICSEMGMRGQNLVKEKYNGTLFNQRITDFVGLILYNGKKSSVI